MAKHVHLTLDDRYIISNLLNSSTSFKAIGIELDKDYTTISKEVRNHCVYRQTGAFGKAFNSCIHRQGCDHRKLCTDCKSNRYCWSCKSCNCVCSDFKRETCSKFKHAPYVCNGCIKLKSCTLEKCFYHPGSAHNEYQEKLSESRHGLSLSEAEIKHLDGFISPLIMKGQSLNHITFAVNQDYMKESPARNVILPTKKSTTEEKRNYLTESTI